MVQNSLIINQQIYIFIVIFLLSFKCPFNFYFKYFMYGVSWSIRKIFLSSPFNFKNEALFQEIVEETMKKRSLWGKVKKMLEGGHNTEHF